MENQTASAPGRCSASAFRRDAFVATATAVALTVDAVRVGRLHRDRLAKFLDASPLIVCAIGVWLREHLRECGFCDGFPKRHAAHGLYRPARHWRRVARWCRLMCWPSRRRAIE